MNDLYVGNPMFPELGIESQLLRPAPIGRAADKGGFVTEALATLRALATERNEVTVDDLYAVLPTLPKNPSEMGALWRAASTGPEAFLQDAGKVKRSTRKEAKGRKVSVYTSLLRSHA